MNEPMISVPASQLADTLVELTKMRNLQSARVASDTARRLDECEERVAQLQQLPQCGELDLATIDISTARRLLALGGHGVEASAKMCRSIITHIDAAITYATAKKPAKKARKRSS